jgi:hypothetical protein
MTVETKAYIVRVALYFASIVLVAWPLHLARPAIGDIAYVAGAAVILGAFYWLGLVITKHMTKDGEASRP